MLVIRIAIIRIAADGAWVNRGDICGTSYRRAGQAVKLFISTYIYAWI